jgi:hypothetical protein
VKEKPMAHKETTNLIVVILIIVVVFVSIILRPILAEAEDSGIVLVLNGQGAISWAMENIKPGDSGNETVNLKNAGSQSGKIVIWISAIVNAEGANPESETGDTAEPGELGTYLLFNLSCGKLKTNIGLPTEIHNLPQSVSSVRYLGIERLNAGEILEIIWQWELPSQVENDTQGDALSFSINYALEELPNQDGGNTWPGPYPIPKSTPTPSLEPSPKPGISPSPEPTPFSPTSTPTPELTPTPASKPELIPSQTPSPEVSPASSTKTPQLITHSEPTHNEQLNIIIGLSTASSLILFLIFMPRRWVVFHIDEISVSRTRVKGLITIQVKSRKGKALTFSKDVKIYLSSSSPTGKFDVGTYGKSEGSRAYTVLPAEALSVSFKYTDKRRSSPTLTATPQFKIGSQNTNHRFEFNPNYK